MSTMQDKGTLYGLVDGAQYPEALAPWVMEFAPEVRSLFEGLPEEEAGYAVPLLFEIDASESEWVQQIDQMDRYRPCFTVIRSTATIDELKTHLQRFLFADIGEGMQVLLRLFDPRSLPAILDVCGPQMRLQLTRPMTLWMYRGSHHEWQRVEMATEQGEGSGEQSPVALSQQQLDELEQRDEPHGIAGELCELGWIDETQPYATRQVEFLRRYGRALKWGLVSRADRHAFCVASYRYGEVFDRHGAIQSAIRSAVAEQTPLAQRFEQIPKDVWQKLEADSERRRKELEQQELGE